MCNQHAEIEISVAVVFVIYIYIYNIYIYIYTSVRHGAGGCSAQDMILFDEKRRQDMHALKCCDIALGDYMGTIADRRGWL